tara:strand:- start:1048 stop:1224 length:177 start_codon:yes stop_codon:yes gene_type:complete
MKEQNNNSKIVEDSLSKTFIKKEWHAPTLIDLQQDKYCGAEGGKPATPTESFAFSGPS